MKTGHFITRENLDAKTAEWLDLIYTRNYPRKDLVIDRSRCALVIVDMLRYFAHPDGRVYLPSTDAVIPRIARLLACWRKSGNTVVFTRHCHEGKQDLGMLGKFFDDYIRCGKPESEIVAELAPAAGEEIFRKHTYDAFYHTGLEEYLRQRGSTQVLVTGVLTQMCCETTARAAFVRGFEVYIAADALTSSTEEYHVGSLLGLASGFAVITDTRTICGGGSND